MSGLAIVGVATLAALWPAPPASAACMHMIGDPAPGYWGSAGGIFCGPEDSPLTWTVPTGISEATFSARGADDAAAGKQGGRVKATLPVAPGQTFVLEAGEGGNASTISFDSTPMLVGGGGNGAGANYLAPGASELESQAAGEPLTGEARDGEFSVSWSTITKAPTACVVPRLKGMRPVRARALLAKAECATGEVSRHPARRRAWGRVTGQWPRAGTELPAGGRVDLQVGRKLGRS